MAEDALEKDLLALQDQWKWATTQADKDEISARYRELHARWMARKGLMR